jgi:hypothetical protein
LAATLFLLIHGAILRIERTAWFELGGWMFARDRERAELSGMTGCTNRFLFKNVSEKRLNPKSLFRDGFVTIFD